jgi:hypothetical protein
VSKEVAEIITSRIGIHHHQTVVNSLCTEFAGCLQTADKINVEVQANDHRSDASPAHEKEERDGLVKIKHHPPHHDPSSHYLTVSPAETNATSPPENLEAETTATTHPSLTIKISSPIASRTRKRKSETLECGQAIDHPKQRVSSRGLRL